MLCPDFEPSEGSLPLLSPPFGMWKLLPPFPLATVGNLAWVLFPLVLDTVLAGILVLELVALLALLANGLGSPWAWLLGRHCPFWYLWGHLRVGVRSFGRTRRCDRLRDV